MAEQAMAGRFVIDFQPKDEAGRPIGKPTHLEADTQEELNEKLRQAYENAVRALHRQNEALARLRAAKPTLKEPEPTFKPKQMTADEEYQAGLEAQNPQTFSKAVAKVVETILPVKEVTTESQEARQARMKAEETRVARLWMAQHSDYYPCEANSRLLGAYLEENGMAWTIDNLEIAFAACEDRLATRPAQKAAPSNETPSNEPATPSNPPQKKSASGIMPGQFTANKPVRAAGMTKKEAVELAKKNPGEYKRMMRDPKLAKILETALNS
jgi:hypothetical protein